MSDVTMFPQHVHLEHHILEMVAFQWPVGMEGKVLEEVALEISREVEMRDATLVKANHRVETGTGNVLRLGIERRSDGKGFSAVLYGGNWLVLHLHEQRLYDVAVLGASEGVDLFRRTRPVVVLRPNLGQVEA